MDRFQELYREDLSAYGDQPVPFRTRRFLYRLRKVQTEKNPLLRKWQHFCFRVLSEKLRMEISFGASIGKGLRLEDPTLITINSNAVLGEYVTLGRNVTIGKQNRGALQGTPVIGNHVTIGANAVIVGKITIGDHVTIAPDAYVNRDIPGNSIAEGNPCRIRAK